MRSRPATPEPFWIGLGLRIARCDCGRRFGRFWPRGARARYRRHWELTHEADHLFRPDWPQETYLDGR